MSGPYPREHGTPRGYRQHAKRGEVPCAACCRGWADMFRRQLAEHPEYRGYPSCLRGLGWPRAPEPLASGATYV